MLYNVNDPTVQWEVRKEIQGSTAFYEGLTSENVVLSQYPSLYPRLDITGPVMDYMFLDKEYVAMKPTFTDSLIKIGAVEMYDAEEIEWAFKARGTEKVVSLGKIETKTKPGARRNEFKIYLSSGKWKESDILYPAVAYKYQVVVTHKDMDGTGFVYTVKLSSYEDGEYFPPALLEKDYEWKKLDATGSEFGGTYGSTEINHGLAKIKFWTHMHTATKSLQITNKAHDIKLRVLARDKESGNYMEDMPEMIIDEREAKFVMENNWEREKRIVLGQGSDKSIIDPSSQFHYRIAPGVFQFMERSSFADYPLYGNYNLVNFMADVAGPTNQYGTIVPGEYDIWTGSGGIDQARRWIKDFFGTLDATLPSEMFYEEIKGDGPFKGIRVMTPYFSEIIYYPYGVFRFHLMPLLDNVEVFGGQRDPETGYLYSSFTYMITDREGQDSNIKLIEKNNAQVYMYNCGTYSPVGPFDSGSNVKGGYAGTSGIHGYELFHSRVHGVRIHDITRTLLMQPDVKLY